MGWPCMLARFSTPSATVAIPSTAYAAWRCRGERHRHAGARSGPASTWISPRHGQQEPGATVSKSGGSVTTTMLELREVSKVYGTGPAQVNALRRVNLSVRGGELVAVMGPSGSGKSSLLTIAGSLEEPTSGQVLAMGTEITHLSPNDQARLRRPLVGYVFQDFNLLVG